MKRKHQLQDELCWVEESLLGRVGIRGAQTFTHTWKTVCEEIPLRVGEHIKGIGVRTSNGTLEEMLMIYGRLIEPVL